MTDLVISVVGGFISAVGISIWGKLDDILEVLNDICSLLLAIYNKKE